MNIERPDRILTPARITEGLQVEHFKTKQIGTIIGVNPVGHHYLVQLLDTCPPACIPDHMIFTDWKVA